MALWGEPGALDACIHLPLMHDLHVQFDVTIIIQFSVYKQQCSYMNRSMHGILEICTGMS